MVALGLWTVETDKSNGGSSLGKHSFYGVLRTSYVSLREPGMSDNYENHGCQNNSIVDQIFRWCSVLIVHFPPFVLVPVHCRLNTVDPSSGFSYFTSIRVTV